MLFTPLLPSAGPTGGEGDACPAPTINLTIWSFAIAFRAIVSAVAQFEMWSGDVLGGDRCQDFPNRYLESLFPTAPSHDHIEGDIN